MMIEELTNKRYRLLSFKNEHYLIDMDTHKLSWILPGLVWLLPFNAYQLNNTKNLEKKVKNKKSSKGVGGLIILSAFFTRFFSNSVPKDFWTKDYFPEFQSLFQIAAIVILIISLLCRYVYSNNCKTVMFDNGLQLGKTNKIICLKKNRFKDFFKIIGFTLILTSIVLWMFFRSIQDTNIILALFSTTCLNWYIYRNLTFRKPDIIDYKIIKKENE